MKQQLEQLQQLVERVQNAIDPPIAEIQAALQKYICNKALPANTATPSVQDKHTVRLAMYACGIAGACKMHFRRGIAELDECFLTAWPGIWRWLQFLNNQCCLKDRYGFKIAALISIFSTLYTMATSSALRNEVTSTPGVITVVAEYWKDQGRYPDMERALEEASFPKSFTTTLNMLLEIPGLDMGAFKHMTPNYLPELITALVSEKAVATHAIKHLKFVLEAEPPDFEKIWAHLSLINTLSVGSAPKIGLAMLNKATIPLVVKTLLWLAKKPDSRPEEESMVRRCVEACFIILMNGMMASNGPSWVSQSLDAGILAAILQSAPRLTRSNELNSSRCSSLLSNILCQYLVYKSVVRSAAKGLRKVERLELDSGSGGPIWEAWAVFKTLLSERMAIKKRFDQSMANQKLCGRMDCRALTDHDELLRCGGCLEEFYCNKECQRMDWSSHKSNCQKLQQILRDGIEAGMSPADRCFIGDIVVTEIMENGKSMEKLITALDSSPFPERTLSDFVFSFDYTKVPVSIRVIPVAKLNDGKEFWQANWNQLLKQALQSNGECMMANAQVQRGGLVAFTTYLMPAPIRR